MPIIANESELPRFGFRQFEFTSETSNKNVEMGYGDNLILSDGEDWVPWNQDERKVR
jgi:hypothetical protein